MRVEGTGLGLSITTGLVELMGGTISVKSLPHRGSPFCVELEGECADGELENPGERGGAESPDAANRKLFAGRRFLTILSASSRLISYGSMSVRIAKMRCFWI